MEYKCWGTILMDACIYLDADNPQEAANKAFAAFQRRDGGVEYGDEHPDEDVAIQEKVDGEYGDENILTAGREYQVFSQEYRKEVNMNYVTCSNCGKRVSNETTEDMVVRAWVQCPECLQSENADSGVFERKLDILPKCPIVRNRTNDAQNECGGERCGFWLKDIRMCSIRALALELRYTQQRLGDIKDNIPPFTG